MMFLAKRFVAGTTAEEALPKVRDLNRDGILATLDVLGENVAGKDEATASADEYVRLLELIDREKVDSNVSLKLTQMGLDIDVDFCFENVMRIVDRAAELDNFVRLDMEGSDYTDKTLDMFRRLYERRKNVGVVIQAMLHRSEADVRRTLEVGGRIRLCKGAYKEPESIAWRKMADIRENYRKLAAEMLASGVYHGIATHDEQLVEWTIAHAKEKGYGPETFEFQMLYGMRRKRQRELAKAGHRIRCYVPYGTHWFPYFTRRLRERKENVFFVLKHLFKD